MNESRPFQVDLRGVIDLLSRHIYSSPQVYLRELLQNSRDAIAARRLLDPNAPAGHVRVSAADGEVRFTDNGIGLTADEAADLLATVGRSSKRDEVLGLRREDFLGQFGIGLLSCFLVADNIVVRSHSATGGPAIEWVGSSDGTFSVRTIEDDQPIGTEVLLRARMDDASLAEPRQVRSLLIRYGEFLPDRIDFGAETINREAPFLSSDPDEVADFGRRLLGAEPLDAIPVSVPGTATTGVAYVLPFSPPPGAKQSHRVYLGHMLLGERVHDLLPDWAFFVRCVVNTEGLSPTASRETFVDNEALSFTRDELGLIIRRWIVSLASDDPAQFATFVAVHQLALKSMALHDDELARALLPHILVETSSGAATLGDLLQTGQRLRYAETVDEFRQVAAVVPAHDPVINAGYTLDTELLRRLPQVFAEASTVRIRVHDVLAELERVPDDQRSASDELERRAEKALTEMDCEVTTRVFSPHDLNALYVTDPTVLRRLERGIARDSAPTLWLSVLDQIDGIADESSTPARPQLCLNWASTLVTELAAVTDDVVFDRSVRLLYVQALLAGHHPLRANDRSTLSSAMSDLIQLSVFRTD